jgi:hypothetical protein
MEDQFSLPDPKDLPRKPKPVEEPPSPRKLAAMRAAAEIAERRRKGGPVKNAKYGVAHEIASDVEKLEAHWDNRAKLEIPKQMEQSELKLNISDRNRIRELAIERIRRRNEALRLWNPMPEQENFHNCTAFERSIIGSNRSGKTTCAAVDFAKIVTGQHPKFSGIKTPLKNGAAAVVGFDWDHIGRVNYKKLFAPGSFKIIRDKITNAWRPYIPLTDEDRKAEAIDAPPLIPKRLIKKIAWKSRALGQPKLVTLKSGWTISFFSSEGEPPQGDAYHLVWFDEEIQNQKWYSEIAMRLADNDGYFIWSATPHVGGDDLIDLHNRSVEQMTHESPMTKEFNLTLFGNCHLSEATKQRVVEKYKNRPEDYRVRVLGEFAVKAFKVYGEFSNHIHTFDPKEVWKKTGGQVPANWSKYVAVDPGNTVCAVLFLAVPPPELGENYYIYKELYIENCNVEKFARAVEENTRSASFEVFVMDMQAGRSTQITGGTSVEGQYHEAMKEAGDAKVDVWSRFKNRFFWPGSNDLDAGITEVKTCLYIDSITALPRLLLAKDRCPHLEQEFDRYQYMKKDGKLTDKPKDKWHHLLDCLRYLCCFRPTWAKPKPVEQEKTAAVKRFLEKQKRANAASREGVVNFGPGGSKRLASA